MKTFKIENEWLVTGGAGFIGSHLIDELIKRDQKVVCVDDFSSGYKTNLTKSSLIEVIEGKVQNINLKKFKNRFKGIFHLAAQASAPKSIDRMFSSSSNNLLSSLKVWELANADNIPVVYASSSAIYGKLTAGDDYLDTHSILSPYSMDKLAVEKYAKLFYNLYDTPSIGLRFFNVYGPRQDPSNSYSGVISIFLDRLLSQKEITLNGGYQTRDFIYVKDVCNTLIEAMDYCFDKHISDVFNVGTGNSITIEALLSTLSKLIKVKPRVVKKRLPKGDPKISNCKTKKLNKVMRVKVENFLSLEKGLESTLHYIKKQRKILDLL